MFPFKVAFPSRTTLPFGARTIKAAPPEPPEPPKLDPPPPLPGRLGSVKESYLFPPNPPPIKVILPPPIPPFPPCPPPPAPPPMGLVPPPPTPAPEPRNPPAYPVPEPLIAAPFSKTKSPTKSSVTAPDTYKVPPAWIVTPSKQYRPSTRLTAPETSSVPQVGVAVGVCATTIEGVKANHKNRYKAIRANRVWKVCSQERNIDSIRLPNTRESKTLITHSNRHFRTFLPAKDDRLIETRLHASSFIILFVPRESVDPRRINA